MKIKKAYIFILSFCVLSVFFTFCYYFSYKHALHQFNKKSYEINERLISSEINDLEETLPVDYHNLNITTPKTKYVLQHYDVKNNIVDEKTLNIPADYVGITRNKLMEKLSEYIYDMPLSEYNKGLYSCELLSFSDNEIVIRKTYDIDKPTFMFYVAIRDGRVIVYNSDLQSIYDFTPIMAEDLPEADRIALIEGIYLKSESELYSLLESYSS
ncbi:MAG TPA: hypothetical protein GXZ90_01815 [Clostridiales bacterium]|nr:hypothetical protein [Clostridiales bacterium]